jgi:hypothetical protein
LKELEFKDMIEYLEDFFQMNLKNDNQVSDKGNDDMEENKKLVKKRVFN